jgi:hypothetical protein
MPRGESVRESNLNDLSGNCGRCSGVVFDWLVRILKSLASKEYLFVQFIIFYSK